MTTNATFYSFKMSGKWYATGRGVITDAVYTVFSRRERQEAIIALNGGKFPGLSSTGFEFHWVIIPDESSAVYNYPLMIVGEPDGL